MIRKAKAEGLNVTCETGPHYLLLDDSCLQEDGRFKMNPPLRSPADREALLEGLADGTIAQCDHTVMIPMTHGVDSLNVAAAAAVAFYQLGLQCQ